MQSKYLGALIGALATGCKASGLYGKNITQPLRGELIVIETIRKG